MADVRLFAVHAAPKEGGAERVIASRVPLSVAVKLVLAADPCETRAIRPVQDEAAPPTGSLARVSKDGLTPERCEELAAQALLPDVEMQAELRVVAGLAARALRAREWCERIEWDDTQWATAQQVLAILDGREP